MEEALAECNTRLKSEKDTSNIKIKELNTLLEQSEKTSQKLLESGRYWRSERNKQVSANANNKIAMPILSGSKTKGAPASSSTPLALTSGLKAGTTYQGIGSNVKSLVTSII